MINVSLGIGILLIVVGAVLTFAITAEVGGVDLDLVGWILMGAGAFMCLLALLFLMPRNRRIRSSSVTTDQAGRQYVTEHDQRVDGV